MADEVQKKDREEGGARDKIAVKRADLEAYRRKMSRARRTIETAVALLDELENEYDKLTEGSTAVS